MVQFIPAKDDWAEAFKNIGGGLVSGYTNRADENAVKKSIMELGPNPSARQILDAVTNTKTYTPQAKKEALSNYLGVSQFEELQRKAKAQEEIDKEKNRISALGKQSPEERKDSYDNYIARGYAPEDAEVMTSPYVADGVKQIISRSIEDEISRGIRKKPSTSAQTPTDEAPIEEEPAPLPVEEAAADVITNEEINPPKNEKQTAEISKEQEWPDLPSPTEMKPAERVKWKNNNQTFNNKELKEVRSKNQANTDALIHYSRLTSLNDTGKVQNGVSRLLIDPDTGEPYKNIQKITGVNKETQQYVKTLNDFISQAKNFFGARVTNFDLQSFKSRLPSLLNTEEGRRAIIEQMRLLTELQSAHDKGLSEGLKHYGNNASYSDIVKVVDNKVSLKEKQIMDKINHLDSATKYLDMMQSNPKYKGMEMVYNPETNKFAAVRPGDIEAMKKKGYEQWRTPL